jgi:hypothetical protein
VENKAGANIRQLASNRREKAVANFTGAALLVILMPICYRLLPGGGLAVLIGIVFIVGAVVLTRRGLKYWEKASRANQGAKGEEQLERCLEPLKQEGWHIEYNLELDWGDADVFLQSPQGNYYVVDVKAHKNGTVFFDPSTKMLMRRYGRDSVYSFGEKSSGQTKDLLRAVKGQATQLKKKRQLRWVTAILCFTQAQIDSKILPEQAVEGVHISKLSTLLWLLRWLDNKR